MNKLQHLFLEIFQYKKNKWPGRLFDDFVYRTGRTHDLFYKMGNGSKSKIQKIQG